MRIVIDGRFYGLGNAGLGRYTIELVKNLANIDKNNKYYLLLRKKYYQSLNLPNNWEKVLVDYKNYTFAEQIKLPKIIKRINPDISHYLHFNVPLFTPKPFIVTIHDMIMHNSKGVSATTLPAYQYQVKRMGYKLVFSNAIKRAIKIITPSKAVKNELVLYYDINPKKIDATYLGLDEKFFSGEKLAKKKDRFLYVGSAYPHKNLVYLIKAVKKLNKKLIIVTSRNVFEKRLQKSINLLKAKDNVEVLGYVNDQKLTNLYREATAFIYPSLLEGFGFQGLEAMASKTLLLASNINVFKEIYKDNAIYFDPKDINSISEALENVVKMKVEEKEQRISKAYLYAKQFTWQKTTKETLKVYNSI